MKIFPPKSIVWGGTGQAKVVRPILEYYGSKVVAVFDDTPNLNPTVYVGRNSWIGAGATVLPRIRIGENAIVGAGAVVTKDVPSGVTVVGVPARPFKKSRYE